MADDDDMPATVPEHQEELRRANEKLKELRLEQSKAHELVDEMREHVEESNELIDSWIEVFKMELDDDGKWQWNSDLTEAWETVVRVAEERDEVLRKWNRLVPKYNAVIAPKPVGRPLAANEAQIAEVKRRHRRSHSLRAIAKGVGLSFGTVRSILQPRRKYEVDRALRKRELDRLRAKAYRDRKRAIDALPKRINEVRRRGDKLLKAAKGLDEV